MHQIAPGCLTSKDRSFFASPDALGIAGLLSLGEKARLEMLTRATLLELLGDAKRAAGSHPECCGAELN